MLHSKYACNKEAFYGGKQNNNLSFSRFLFLLFSWLGYYCEALNPIEIRGYKFFDTVTGAEFRIRGIDYYPRPNTGDLNHNSIDYFTEEHRHIWERDLPYLQDLGVNAIRIYAINSDYNHDAFFCALDRAGIYVIVELAHDCPTCAITKDESPICYPPELKLQGQDVIRQMSKYTNVLGFSAGNEVNHYAPPGVPQHNAPCQKKFLRDMRQYVASCGASHNKNNNMRRVPIGLVAADSDRTANALYYNCQSNPNDPFENAEWFGLNSYVNCDGRAQTYQEALGFNTLQQNFASYNYSIPVILTEFGCLSDSFPTVDGYHGQRDFKQAYWLHTIPSVRDQFVGGFAFEYSIEMENAKSESPYPFTKFGNANYGIGYFGPEDCDDKKIPCAYHPLPSFENLRQAYVAIIGDNTTTTTSATTSNDSVVSLLIGNINNDLSEYRKGRSTCPSDFPALTDFEWEADDVQDLACPSREQDITFVCPANLDDLRPRPPLLSRPNLLLAAGLFVTALLIVTAGISLLLAVIYGRQQQQQQNAKEAEHHHHNHNHHLPWPTVVVIPKLRRGDGDTASSESVGLLSMTDMPKGDYHAIDSDSSSRDN